VSGRSGTVAHKHGRTRLHGLAYRAGVFQPDDGPGERPATHPDGAVTPSDRERLQRALVQLEMALAMTKQLAQLRAQKYRVTWNRIVFAWGKLPKLARLFQ
jgi:hypothetical protein